MRLKKRQKEMVLQAVAEGLETDEINKRAEKFKPPFSVSRSQVDFYRKTRDVNFEAIKNMGKINALTTGLSIKDERVAVLQKLAGLMIANLLPDKLDDSLLWTTEAKTIANTQYDYFEFNKAEVDALRGVLDDIAAEVGDRVRKVATTTPDGNEPAPPSTIIVYEK